MELSKLINRLKGCWKIANNAKTTNFIIVDQNILKGRIDKIPPYLLETIQLIYRKAEDYVAKSHLKPESQI